jgi:hypothetical protein
MNSLLRLVCNYVDSASDRASDDDVYPQLLSLYAENHSKKLFAFFTQART